MESQKSLSVYSVSENTPIFLENKVLGLQSLEYIASEQELDSFEQEDTNEPTAMHHNPKYLQKIGILQDSSS